MDLSTNYMGIELPHPLMAGAGPLAESEDRARQLEDAGAAAIVMPSLFEEEIDAEALAMHRALEVHSDSHGEASTYFSPPDELVLGPDAYLTLIARIRDAVDIPVIASLNGYTPGGWLRYAHYIEQADASALELNLYVVASEARETASKVEADALAIVRAITSELRIPVAIKLSPFYTSLTHFASQLEAEGAKGLVLFNRFFEADLDIEALEQTSHLRLSTSDELLLRLRWLAILSGQLTRTTLAVTGGVHTAEDAIKATMCGAAAIQMVSSLLRSGVGHLGQVKLQMTRWMEEKEYHSLSQMRGSMNVRSCPDPKALSRANYMHQLRTWRPSAG